MDRNSIKGLVSDGIAEHDRKYKRLTPHPDELIECIADQFITAEDEAIDRVIELYPEAADLLKAFKRRE